MNGVAWVYSTGDSDYTIRKRRNAKCQYNCSEKLNSRICMKAWYYDLLLTWNQLSCWSMMGAWRRRRRFVVWRKALFRWWRRQRFLHSWTTCPSTRIFFGNLGLLIVAVVFFVPLGPRESSTAKHGRVLSCRRSLMIGRSTMDDWMSTILPSLSVPMVVSTSRAGDSWNGGGREQLHTRRMKGRRKNTIVW